MMRTVTMTMVLAGLVLTGCEGVEKPAPVAPVEPAAKTATVSPPRDVEPADASREIVFATASSDLEDPAAAGKAAAQAAKDQVGARPVKAVLISECYEGKDRKMQVLAGVAGVFTATLIHGGSTYGSFLQSGLAGGESVSVLVIAGKDVDVKVACNEKLDTAGLTLEQNKAELEKRLAAGGAELARRLPRTGDSRLLIVIADAHSPKNGPLVAGSRRSWASVSPSPAAASTRTPDKAWCTTRARCWPTPPSASCCRATSRWPWRGDRRRRTTR